jgi:phosphoribosylformylglycinamidine synthase
VRPACCREHWCATPDCTSSAAAWTTRYEVGAEILVPVKNIDGQYVAENSTLDELEAQGRVVFRYAGVNPNGSLRDIAGITDARGRVVGLMPHPEHAVDALTGPSDDGLGLFLSMLDVVVAA